MNRFFVFLAVGTASLLLACGDQTQPGKADAGSQVVDAGSQEPDAGHQEPDAGHQEPDAGHQEPDAGHQEPDAGHQEPDAGHQEPDAGHQEPDAGHQEPDLTTIPPSDPRIQYTGRIDFSGHMPRFSHPGVSIRARFTGSTLHLLMQDHGRGTDTSTNYYDVAIDDGAPVRLEVRGDTTSYAVASQLSPGEHVVRVTKRTESEVGSSELLGFQIRGTLLEPPARPARRMEFIGDSTVCGYGNEVSIPAPPEGNPDTGFHSINENHARTWVALTARSLGAEGVTVCYSGRGVYRNIDYTTQGTLPQLYDRIIPAQEEPRWDVRRYVPDVVVINLGTNDFIRGSTDETLFKTAYTDFVTRLRGYYPQAKIVCVVGPMLNDYYPPGEQSWTKIQSWVSQMVKGFNDQGDAAVYYLPLTPQQSPYGEDWHPTAASHELMADKLTTLVQSITGW